MGDRAIIVFTDGREFSPGIYLHWHGNPESVAELLEKAEPRLREGDISYSAARFGGVCHEEIAGNLSLGLVDSPKPNQQGKIEWETYSPGDNGVFIIDVNTWQITRQPQYTKE